MMLDNQWSGYADSFDSFEDYNHFLEPLFDLLGPVESAKILDLGCSNGLMCRLLSSKRACLTGVDISEHAIAVARELTDESDRDISYDVADASDLSLFQDAAFDRVLAVNTLCSFGDDAENMRRITEEIHRVLAPGGALVAVLPHPAFEHQQKSVTRNRVFPDNYSYFHGGTPVTFDLKIGSKAAQFSNVHWTLEDYSRFFQGLFSISAIREPEPDASFDRLHAQMFGDGPRYPIYLLLKCVKC